VRLPDALRVLARQDGSGRYVFVTADLRLLLGESGDKLAKTLDRLVAGGVLERACRAVYVYRLSRHLGADTIAEVAVALRRYHYNYLSYESALSEWGAISQKPLDRITVATTGREGEFSTPYGVVEFTHTDLSPEVILANTVDRSPNPLPIATAGLALRNLRRAGRDLDLVDAEGEAAWWPPS
jgi:predicted transcriptional regulator of viral defense system